MPTLLEEMKQKGIAPKAFDTKNTTTPISSTKKISPVLKGFVEGGPISKTMTDIPTGFAKGAVSTIGGLSSLGESILSFGQTKREDTAGGRLQQKVKPKTIGESIGFGIEQVAEFFVPGGATRKVETVLSNTLSKGNLVGSVGKVVGSLVGGKLGSAAKKITTKVGQGAVKAGTSMAEVSAVAEAQAQASDEISRQAKIAGLLAVGGTLVSPVTSGLAGMIQRSVVRPLKTEMDAGFKLENMKKYGLYGSPQDSLKKTDSLIKQRSSELSQLISNNPSKVEIRKVMDDTIKEVTSKGKETFGINRNIRSAADNLKSELNELVPNGLTDLVSAQEIKRATGKLGAWQYGRFDPDATATEQVANVFYSKLKSAIEKVEGTGKVKQLNSEMSELIPIEHALIRRIPVTSRQNILSLSDMVILSSSPQSLTLFLVNKLSKMGEAAKFLGETGEVGKGRMFRPAATQAIEGANDLIDQE